MAKKPVIWNPSTAVEVAAAKSAKHGVPFMVVPAKGGGSHVVPVMAKPGTASQVAAAMGIAVVQVEWAA